MNDDDLAPFVDALASCLIIMILVCLFFLIQSMTAMTKLAKKTVVDEAITKQNESPIYFLDSLYESLEFKKIKYVVNFKLKEGFVKKLRESVKNAKKIKITIKTPDENEKSVYNLLTFIKYLDVSESVKIEHKFVKVASPLSEISWQLK